MNIYSVALALVVRNKSHAIYCTILIGSVRGCDCVLWIQHFGKGPSPPWQDLNFGSLDLSETTSGGSEWDFWAAKSPSGDQKSNKHVGAQKTVFIWIFGLKLWSMTENYFSRVTCDPWQMPHLGFSRGLCDVWLPTDQNSTVLSVRNEVYQNTSNDWDPSQPICSSSSRISSLLVSWCLFTVMQLSPSETLSSLSLLPHIMPTTTPVDSNYCFCLFFLAVQCELRGTRYCR